MIHHGDSLEVLKTLPENSVDAVVTDPPYGLSFMNKKWDYDVPTIAMWSEVFRVLKPGGHLLSFGGTRTYHRMVVAIEDAGFEIRDQIQWLYGSGFPKSMNVALAIDKQSGAIGHRGKAFRTAGAGNREDIQGKNGVDGMSYAEPITDQAKQWQGFGTALKPANEPIVLARKPLEKGLTVSANVLKWGCGAINVDGSRIASENNEHFRSFVKKPEKSLRQTYDGARPNNDFQPTNSTQGRWPANVLFDETAAEMLDEQSGRLGSRPNKNPKALDASPKWYENKDPNKLRVQHPDIYGGASRFFYVAKSSKRERNKGLEGMPLVKPSQEYNLKAVEGNPRKPAKCTANELVKNNHPTVKPIKLMEYLCRLITPPGGTVLDPFMGSGSTGVACKNLGFEFVGIEMNEEYIEIAKRRIG